MEVPACSSIGKGSAQGLSPEHPLASPLFTPLGGFPPTMISIGTGEVLADDGRSFYEALTLAGVSAQLHEVDGMEHIAVVRGASLPGAEETFAKIASFIDKIVQYE